VKLASGIYTGEVRHRRSLPVENSFRYSLYMMYLDLGELDHVFSGRWLWSTERFNLAWLRRRDHLGDPSLSLDEAVRRLVEERSGARPRGPIRVLTQLRYYGYCFNPVSFYYCFDEDDRHVDTLLAEVHNTPWNEEYCYVLDERSNEGTRGEKRFRFPKEFHVSPFMDMNVSYDWHFTEPSESLEVRMIDYRNDEKLFEAHLQMKREETSGGNLARMLVTYPFMTGKIIGAIYWQALRLRLKGAPFYVHPKKRKDVTQG
jgi:DUF1365 family protein